MTYMGNHKTNNFGNIEECERARAWARARGIKERSGRGDTYNKAIYS